MDPSVQVAGIAALQKSRRDAYNRRAREKLASDLNTIEAIVGTLPNFTCRPYGLPIEMEGNRRQIWDSIFKNINDFETIIYLREVCVMFNELLQRKFIATMLPQLIGNRFLDMSAAWEGGRNGWLRSLSSLRTLSRVSKKSVDSIISGSFLRKDDTDWFITHGPHYRIREEAAILRLGSSQIEVNRLDRTFDQLEVENNPEDIFPLTSVIINEVPRESFAEMNPDLPIHRENFKLLFEEMIGTNITSFLYRTKGNSFETYANLTSWVTHMPNLRDLIVDLQRTTPLRRRRWERRGRLTIEPFPAFPTCPRLRRYAEGRNGLGVPFSKEILRANPTIQEVLLGDTVSTSKEWDSVKEMLNALHITKFHCVRLPDVLFVQHRFPWAQQLTTLALWDTCPTFRLSGDIDSTILFSFISGFMNLKKLLVSTPYIRDTGGSLNLLKLKHLVWGVFPTFKTLKFLEPAEGLESLDLDVSMCADTKRTRKAFRFLEEWSVPSLFPMLRMIRLRTQKDGQFLPI